MRSLALAFALLATMAPAALAHRLKVFAAVEDSAISGYGFFIGGGRTNDATVIIRDGGGREVYRGATGRDGQYSWRPPAPSNFTVVIDTREGHVAEAQIRAERFSEAPSDPTSAMAAPAAPKESHSNAAPANSIMNAEGCASAVDGAGLANLVDKAVARQIRPLLEEYAAAEGRIRFNDVAGGLGMIAGLAGLALWATSRRRNKAASPSDGV